MIRHALAAALLVLALAACGENEDAATDTPGAGVVLSTPVPTAEADTETPRDKPGAALTSVLKDVNTLAPALESYFRGDPYPTTVAEVVAALPKAQLKLSKGNTLGGYRYDPDEVEFVLCVENTSGAFATYDTAPMATGKQGETGGCPAL